MKVVIHGYTTMPCCGVLVKHFVAFKLQFVPGVNHLAFAYPHDECLCNEECIYIRYSCLRKLHFDIVKRFNLCNNAVQFPSKSLILTKNVLNKRMKQLETYMNYILSLHEDFLLQVYIRNWFMEYINTSSYKDMVNNVTDNKKTHNNSNNSTDSNSDNDINDTNDDSERKVVELLKVLRVFPMNVSEYLSAFGESASLLSKEGIYLLFFGSECEKGLLYYIGQDEHNLYGAISCLLFISKLIACEYSVNYDLFRKILRLGSVSKIKLMHLEKLITMNSNEINKACFSLIRCLCEEEGCFNEEFWFTHNNTLHYEQYTKWLGSN